MTVKMDNECDCKKSDIGVLIIHILKNNTNNEKKIV